jgi:parvulin-like peptidyl-prolyl isomerase
LTEAPVLGSSAKQGRETALVRENAKGSFKRPNGVLPIQRFGLLVFGVLLLVLFILLAVTEGIGDPGVPSGDVAVIEDAPDGLGTISREDLARAVETTAARAQIQPVPKPGEEKYEELQETALGERLDSIWIQGQAEEMSIGVTPEEVAKELKKLKGQAFETEQEYKEYLEEAHYTQAGIEEQVEVQMLSSQIQEQVESEKSVPSSDEVEAYYEAAKTTQYTREETREARALTFKNKSEAEKAKTELEKDDSEASWKRVGAGSDDPDAKKTGGLVNDSAKGEGTAPEPLHAALFSATEGKVEGPLSTSGGYDVFEVMAITPENVSTFEEVEASIKSTLEETANQQHLTSFVTDFNGRWTSRTFCAAGYTIERCANFKGGDHSAEADPACFEASPEGGGPEAGCPASVVLPKPALPGSITPLAPEGRRLAQGPLPAPGGAGSELTGGFSTPQTEATGE